ncbi:MAG TPA: hypothetical protein VF169_03910 [Albitalea sp.]|uniref:hypothetical protein n=1 Tax=Piscinibacter sp. TaxID=1903157 RepID=UPI002ED165FC
MANENVEVVHIRYRCDFFRQRPKAPIQCSFVATTADIADWSTVPKKAASDLRNFQRPEMPEHVEEISEFFEKFEDNSSPSAIVLGFRGTVKTLNEKAEPFDINTLKSGEFVAGYIEIPSIQLPTMNSIEEKRAALRQLVKLIPATVGTKGQT